MKQRTPYIDIVKGIGIFLLLFEHVGNWVGLNGAYNQVKVWICSFHMPLFFIAYGLAVPFCQNAKWSFCGDKIRKRAVRILIPYILWSAIYAPKIDLKYLLAIGYGTNMSLSWDGNNAVLWFLPAMFSAVLIDYFTMFLIGKIRKGNASGNAPDNRISFAIWDKVVLLSLILIECIIGFFGHKVSLFIPNNFGIWFSFDIAFVGAAFINAGRLMMAVFHEAAKRMNKIVFVIAAVFLCLATFFIANRNQPGDSWVAIMAWGKYGNHFALFFLNACLATFAILLIAYCLNNFSVLAGFGKNKSSDHGLSLYPVSLYDQAFNDAVSGKHYDRRQPAFPDRECSHCSTACIADGCPGK